jgi:hypothetical protein
MESSNGPVVQFPPEAPARQDPSTAGGDQLLAEVTRPSVRSGGERIPDLPTVH